MVPLLSRIGGSDHKMTIEQQAEKEAQKIFYKIENLVFDAVRVELKDEIDAIIDDHFAQERKLAQERAKQPRNENATSQGAKDKSLAADDYAAIRQIIDDYVRQSLEEQAPAIITKTLAHALSSEALTPKKPS